VNAMTLTSVACNRAVILLPSPILPARRLLTAFVERPERQTGCPLEDMPARARTVTAVLEEILECKGFPHGGINE